MRRHPPAASWAGLTSGIASIDWWRGQSYYDSGDWRGTWELDGGGALMNQGVHTVDLLVARWAGRSRCSRTPERCAHERIEVEDVAVGVVRFESGALGVLHATTAAYPGLSARPCTATGSSGSSHVIDQRRSHAACEATSRSALWAGPGQLPARVRRRPCSPRAAIRGQLSDAHRLQYLELPRRAGRKRAAAGGPGDQPAVDRRHHRGVRVPPVRAAGPMTRARGRRHRFDVTTTSGAAARPIPPRAACRGSAAPISACLR